MKKGYTLAEMLIVIAIIAILALISMANFVNRRNKSHLTSTVSAMAGLLREAQSRSVAQSSSTSWGVHFDNGTTPYFALFAAPYSSSSHMGYYQLPAWVGYSTSSIAEGNSAEVTFSQVSGARNGSTSITVYLIQGAPASTYTLNISAAGSVSY